MTKDTESDSVRPLLDRESVGDAVRMALGYDAYREAIEARASKAEAAVAGVADFLFPGIRMVNEQFRRGQVLGSWIDVARVSWSALVDIATAVGVVGAMARPETLSGVLAIKFTANLLSRRVADFTGENQGGKTQE